ncbi:BEL1-like homeodomain protein 9 [Linum perenne]
MAEGYEAYHVPQQSRRDKLRELQLHHHHHVAHNTNHNNSSNNLLLHHPHLYDPPHPPPSSSSSDFLPKHHSNFTGFISSSPNYMDSINPTDIHSQSPNPFLNFNPSTYSSAAAAAVLFKPEPLSLSLSSSSSHHQHQHQQQQQQNFQTYVLPTGINPAGGGTSGTVVSRCSDVVPLGPFTGYASILKGSRFLNPAQQLLEEFCDVVGGGILIPPGDKIAPDPSLLDPPPLDCLDDPLSSGSDFGAESHRKKSRLISMLDEVYRRYKQYYQQMETVVTSFECVAGLGNAAPYANLALKAMSKHFRSLKNAIADQLSKASAGKDDHALASVKLGNSTSYGIRHNGQSSALIEHHQPVWRPQRGLPERAVTVLRAWLFEHFLHPYPTDTDKLMLAKQTGLSRSQVSNWFINARVRLWKPMVEEIHTLETRQAQKAANKDHHERNGANKSTCNDHHQPPYSNTDAAGASNPSTSSQPALDVPMPKRTRNELPPTDHMSVSSSEEQQHHHHQQQHQHQQQMYHNNNNNNNNNMQSYGGGGFSGGHQTHLGMEAGGGSVSLTLGLHQGIGFLEPPPFAITSAAAQRFGLDTGGGNEGYNVMGGGGGGGFDSSQNRHFGRDVMGGQLLHDFVG